MLKRNGAASHGHWKMAFRPWKAIILESLYIVSGHTQCSFPSSENMIQSNDPPKEMKGEIWQKPDKSIFNHKLSSSLNGLLEAYQREGMTGAKIFAKNHNLVLQDNRIQVTIVTSEEAIDDVRIAVKACDGEYQLHYRTLLQAMVPITALKILAKRPDVESIREPQRAILQQ